MRIQFNQGVAGERFAYRTGEKIDLRDDIALAFIKQGVAVPVREPEVERAIVGPLERAVRRVRRAGR